MSDSPTIRLLTGKDAEAYQVLRLKSLRDFPEAFLSDPATEETYDLQIYVNHLNWSHHPPYLGYFGIFIGDVLAGYVQVSKSMLDKQDHVVFLNNVYVDSNFQERGLGSMLMNHVFNMLKNEHVAERAFISATAKNKNAISFYKKLGFRRYAVQSQVVKWNGVYDDAIEFVKVL